MGATKAFRAWSQHAEAMRMVTAASRMTARDVYHNGGWWNDADNVSPVQSSATTPLRQPATSPGSARGISVARQFGETSGDVQFDWLRRSTRLTEGARERLDATPT